LREASFIIGSRQAKAHEYLLCATLFLVGANNNSNIFISPINSQQISPNVKNHNPMVFSHLREAMKNAY